MKKSSRPIAQDQLTPTELDVLWNQSVAWREIPGEAIISNALSGDDKPAAESFLYWLHRSLKAQHEISDDVRAYAVGALDAYLSRRPKRTLGEAFGVERAKRGKPRNRLGATAAINGVIGFLNQEKGYSLGIPASGPSAFDVASQLLAHRWKLKRSPETLRKHWQDRKRDGKSE